MKAKTLLVILVIVSLMLTSEAIFQLRNNPSVQIPAYLRLTRMLATAGRVEVSLKFFGKAYDIRLKQLNYGENDKLIPENQLPDPPQNDKLISDYKNILKSMDVKKLTTTYDTWGKILYNLGLSAYRNGETDLVIPFWQKALAIAPEWSYFHVELANYYLNLGQTDKAGKQLEYCLEFHHPKSFCQHFVTNNLEKEVPEEIGFLESKINDEI